MPKVSIVVPVYNAIKTLDKCIKSILNQSLPDFELILVNDGSTDKSLQKCLKYQYKDNRVKVIKKKNEGCIKTRRRGIDAAQSSYIMFVDADDWIHSETIETLYKSALESDADIIVCNMYKVLGKSGLIRRSNKSNYFSSEKLYAKEEVKNKLVVAYFHGHPFPASLAAKLYKRSFLIDNGKYLERIKFSGEDLFYNIEIFSKVNKVKIINKPLYYYRTGGGTSKYMPYFFEDIINGYQIQKEIINQYFSEKPESPYNGISIMLLNSFKTCLDNLFHSSLTKDEKLSLIKKFTSDPNINEAILNKRALQYFPIDYIEAIKKQDINYLYDLGEFINKKAKPKRTLMKFASIII